MKKQSKKSLRVGILVFAALLIFVFFIYFIGSKDNLFKQKTYIITSFRDIRGVVVGNNVRYSGITVGKVSDITITSDSTVELRLTIASQYARFIYRDAFAEISQDGLVGNKIINITSGNSDAGVVINGTHLRGREGIDVDNMLYITQDLLAQTKEAIQSLSSIAIKIDRGDGDLAILLNDNKFSKQIDNMGSELTSSLAKLNLLINQVSHGDGDIAKLLNSTEMSEKGMEVLSSLTEMSKQTQAILNDLEKTTGSINTGDGTINMLLNNKETAQNIDSTILMLQGSLLEIDKTARAIQNSWIINRFSKKK